MVFNAGQSSTAKVRFLDLESKNNNPHLCTYLQIKIIDNNILLNVPINVLMSSQ